MHGECITRAEDIYAGKFALRQMLKQYKVILRNKKTSFIARLLFSLNLVTKNHVYFLRACALCYCVIYDTTIMGKVKQKVA